MHYLKKNWKNVVFEKMMKVRIRYYGKLTETSGCDEEEISINPASTLSVLEQTLVGQYPLLSRIPLIFFSNAEKCTGSQLLAEGMQIECMPPFSGG